MIFSLDAALALLLLFSIAGGALLFSSSATQTPVVEQTLHTKAADAVLVLSRIRLADVRREPVVRALFDDSVLSPGAVNQTVMQTLADLWASADARNLSLAQNLSDYFLSRFFLDRVNYAVFASNQSLSSRTPAGYYDVAAVSRSVVSGVSSQRALTQGCVARAFIQNIRGKQEQALAYFGGFEGQGNLTALVRGVPGGANITDVYLEANAGTNFTLYLNGVSCGLLNRTAGAYDVNRWLYNASQNRFCLDAAKNGSDNVFHINFTGANVSQQYLGGGLVRITFQTDQLASAPSGTFRHYFNGVDGIINSYSSFYVPGQITYVTGRLGLNNNYSTFLIVGNRTVYQDNGTDSFREVNVSNAIFSTAFANYSELSLKTVPLRLGVRGGLSSGLGNADVVLITDVSGSMSSRMDSSSTGISRSCADPLLYDPSTQRLSVAKCIDKNFVQAILSGTGNRVALVSFDDDIANYTLFTTDGAYLNATIDSYRAGSGTCIACAINKAHELIGQWGGPDRLRQVVVMSDGVTSLRGAAWCGLRDTERLGGIDVVSGDKGGVLHLNSSRAANWTDYATGQSTALYSVSAKNGSIVFAAGQSGKFFRYDGTVWTQTQDAGNMDFYGIDVWNASFGFAVGTSGQIYQYNGVSWALNAQPGSHTLRAVSIHNGSMALAAGFSGSTGYLHEWNGSRWSTISVSSVSFYDAKTVNGSWGFAVGTSGKIYRWNGLNWAQHQDTGSQTWYALSVGSPSLAFVAGSSGAIYRWNGTTFSSFTSPTTQAIYGISFSNSTSGSIVTSNGLVYAYDGAWNLVRDARSTGTLSSGVSCGDSSSCSTPLSNNYAALNANSSSCRMRRIFNSTHHAVGFGPISTCSLAKQTLSAVAQCGNGTFFASVNASELAGFYANLAQRIVQQANASQAVVAGPGIRTTLSADSYLEFTYQPQYVPPFQSLSLLRSVPLSSCQDTLTVPSMTIYDFKVTSYSADRWTHNVSISNARGWQNAFNLSAYNATAYSGLGDPFLVQVDPRLLQTAASNVVDVRTAGSPLNQSDLCSSSNQVSYRGWINASVGFGAFYPTCLPRNVSVFYDLDADNVPDGSVFVLVGGVTSENAILAEQLNQNGSNAVEDAFKRLLDQLDLNKTGGASGSVSNPIDVALSREVSSNSVSSAPVPALNSTDVSVIVWK